MFPTKLKRVAELSAIVFTVVLLTASNTLAQHFTRTDLTANNANVATVPNIDPNLVNAWGMSRSSGSPWWISDNGTGLSTLYNAAGQAQGLVVTIPTPTGDGTSAPTGTVFNAFSGSFEVTPGNHAIFLFSSEDGTISGWNPNVDGTHAVIKVDNSKTGAVYKGLAIGVAHNGPRLYVSNIISGQVEAYDHKFRPVKLHNGAFTDSRLPTNYAPFGIQNVGGNIVVTFAKRTPGSKDEIGGAAIENNTRGG